MVVITVAVSVIPVTIIVTDSVSMKRDTPSRSCHRVTGVGMGRLGLILLCSTDRKTV